MTVFIRKCLHRFSRLRGYAVVVLTDFASVFDGSTQNKVCVSTITTLAFDRAPECLFSCVASIIDEVPSSSFQDFLHNVIATLLSLQPLTLHYQKYLLEKH